MHIFSHPYTAIVQNLIGEFRTNVRNVLAIQIIDFSLSGQLSSLKC